MLFIPCIVNDLQIVTVPTNSQFHYFGSFLMVAVKPKHVSDN